MAREAVAIRLFSGTFESQPLVFAHLWDAAPELRLDHVEVICRQAPEPRLHHYMDAEQAQLVTTEMGLETTLVMFLPGAGHFAATPRLRWLADITGTRAVP